MPIKPRDNKPRIPPNHSIRFWVEDGEIVAQVEGVSGKGCEGLLDILNSVGVTTDEEWTPDHDRPEPQGRALRPRTQQRTGK